MVSMVSINQLLRLVVVVVVAGLRTLLVRHLVFVKLERVCTSTVSQLDVPDMYRTYALDGCFASGSVQAIFRGVPV